ncbi:hypothetical protein ACFLY4_00130 [Chloroflexota bacterium]
MPVPPAEAGQAFGDSIRVLPGSPKRTHPELPSIPVEQFLAMLRFEQRDKLVELPGDLLESGRDDFT